MPRLLTVSRAARLVGVSRGTLQKQIQDGELTSFEGQVNIDDLARAYPQVQLEDNAVMEKIENIIDNALKRARGDKLRKLLAPDLSTLAARVASLSKELARTKHQNKWLNDVIKETQNKILELEATANPGPALAKLRVKLGDALEKPVEDSEIDELIVRDTVLRVMAAQVHLMPSGHEFFVEGNNSILEAGLSAGLALNYGCSNGNCGKCKAKLISGEVKNIKQHDYVIPEAEKNQGYILACSNTAISDIVLQAEEAGSEEEIPLQKISARVKKVDRLTDNLAVVNLRTPRTDRLRFLAGQRAILSTIGVEPVEYHIASCPCDDMNLQFHICKQEDNPFAEYVFNRMQNSESIMVEGPHGNFILREDTTRPLLFVAFGTGFAPIKSLIEHAMTLDVNEFSHLYWFHKSEGKPYLHNQGRAWADAFDDFRYTPQRISDLANPKDITDSLAKITKDYPDLDDFDVYACGPETSITTLQDFFDKQKFPSEQLFIESL
jgi:CDP-4-dehydro-6-deoxyglucose reductase